MLREKLKSYTIILASGSPRRQQFFRDLDIDFEIRLKEVEEVYPPHLQAEEIPLDVLVEEQTDEQHMERVRMGDDVEELTDLLTHDEVDLQ